MRIAACPMSTLCLAEGPSGIVAAWDTEGQIYFASVKSGSAEVAQPLSAPGTGKARKHPAIAFNAQGEMILVWTEGTAWQKGGDLVWQEFDKSGKPTNEKGRVERGIPVWGLPTVVTKQAGFTIIH